MSVYNVYGVGDYTFVYPEWPGLKITALEDNSSLIFYTYNASSLDIDLYYSNDGKNWSRIENLNNINFEMDKDEYLYFWNKNNTLSNSNGYFSFMFMQGTFNISGNCNSMINFDDVNEYCFWNLFSQCFINMGPVDASELLLPSTTLATKCYYGMFSGLRLLEYAPYLPATTLASYCYENLFYYCKSLKEIKIAYSGNFTRAYFSQWILDEYYNILNQSGTMYYNGSDTTHAHYAIPTNFTVQSFQ